MELKVTDTGSEDALNRDTSLCTWFVHRQSLGLRLALHLGDIRRR